MNDETLNLALSIYSNPGVYALLLGSGISRSAAIPTGWEIVTDLISKLKKLSGDSDETDLMSWYKSKYSEEPDYSRILERISPTQTERNSILRAYFEPTAEEREQQLKIPTEAHKAIVSMVKDGYVKMIITTNFDRLLELALEEQGITPVVVSTDDAISGAFPYIHSNCTVVKVHGDYRDTRIRNTKDELEDYSPVLNSYLDRILDEFGLIVCGWSGEWDVALRNAIIRCPSRRFTTYWALRHAPQDDAMRLIEHRSARTIQIESADNFLTNLCEKVMSLKQLEPFNPVSIPVAIATVKRFLSEDKFDIRLHDFVSEEIEKCRVEIESPRFVFPKKIEKELFQARINDYERTSYSLCAILTPISYFGQDAHSVHASKAINRLSETKIQQGLIALVSLQRYPALLILYSCGITALAAEKWVNLAAVLNKTTIREDNKNYPAIKYLHVWEVFKDKAYKWVPRPDAEREYTPANEYISSVLRDTLKPYIPSDTEYTALFDIFEYLLALVYIDTASRTPDSTWGPLGCFSWRYKDAAEDGLSTPIDEFFAKGTEIGEDWGLLTAGFFSGSLARLNIARDKFGTFLKEVRSQRW